MKKLISVIVIILLLGLLVINQIDSPPEEGIYTRADLIPADFSPENGFYILVALAEPPEVNVLSEETIAKYQLFDPGEISEEQKKRSRKWSLVINQGLKYIFLASGLQIRICSYMKLDTAPGHIIWYN